jgi:excisionase family DNA binding protein
MGDLRPLPIREDEDWITKKELAKRMGVSRSTIDNWLAEGMPSETWGLRLRVFQPSVAMAWARNRRRAA